ncbi:hypothetical protein IJD44_08815 [bacterium]|nr:hypothetical protein [bacterium]
MNKKLFIISVVVAALYAIFTLNTVLHHEVWADEAQVWQLCKTLSLDGLIEHLKNEGHPPLFYLITMPFAKLFSDIIYMKLICWGAMCFAVFMLMYYSPFNMWLKLAIVLSSGFLYFFPVLARNYSIIPFLVFLAAILYSKSKQHPILYATTVACIANTHIIMFVFAISLGIIFYYENILLNLRNKTIANIKSYIIPLIIMFIGFFFVFFELSNTPSSNVSFKINFVDTGYTAIRMVILFFISSFNYDLCWQIQYYAMGFSKQLTFSIIDILTTVLMIIMYAFSFIVLFVNSKKWFFVSFLSIGFQFAIYVFAYNNLMYVNRVFCAHLILLFCVWMLFRENCFKSKYKFFGKTSITIILTIFFSLTIFNGVKYSLADIKREYAGARKTAEFIQNNLDPKDSVMLIESEPYMIALVYYLKGSHELYSVFRKKNLRYVIWDSVTRSNYADAGWAGYVSYLKETDRRDHYVINVKEDKKHVLEKTQKDSFELIYTTGDTIEPLEGHRIYKYIGG